jgi:hypothetical protein
MLEPADDAWLALARISADLLDAAERDPAESRYTVGVLAGRHRRVLTELADRNRHRGDTGSNLARLLASFDHDPLDSDPDSLTDDELEEAD